MSTPAYRPETLAIHTGVYKDSAFNSVTTPIYPTSTFAFERVGVTKGYDYTRSGNPTRKALEENLAALEGGIAAWATATGMAAVTIAMLLLKQGDHLITGNDIYGGSYRLLKTVMPELGIETSFINMRDPAEVKQAIRPNTRAMLIETPSNPLLNLIDIEKMVAIAKAAGLFTICDNTFMSPALQSPLAYGVDVVIHSTTKYLNGHSDVVGGALIVKEQAFADKVGFLVNALGVGCSPFDAWLVLRGLKTLTYRLAAHQHNAQAVAEFLSTHEHVKKVYFPGLKDHPDHELAKRQMRGFGGMVTFDLDLAAVDIDKFFATLKLFLLAESLGGVESLVEQPWTMSHSSMDEDARKTAGLSPATIRLSIGIEHPDDLIEDLKAAFEAARK